MSYQDSFHSSFFIFPASLTSRIHHSDTEEQKKRFAEHSDEYLDYCKKLESEVSEMFKNIQVGTAEAEQAKAVSNQCETLISPGEIPHMTSED